MCGFVGYINCGDRAQLEQATDILKHRGPDDKGLKWFGGTGLGHCRLSILDLSPKGHQPMYFKESGDWIVYNGEIYNFKEIRRELQNTGINFESESDTEVILKAYYKWGKNCLDRFNGMFAFIIYNEHSKHVFGARDRLGIKPFYYYHYKEKLIVASEIKAILQCSLYKKIKKPDYEALLTPVHYQVAPNTGFKDIYKLPAGHYLNFKGEKLEINRYWDIEPSECYYPDEEAYLRLEELLTSSVQLQMIADVDVGLLLSGGLDSSIIGALMKKHTKKHINSFTIKFDKADLKKQGNVDDSYYAKKFAEESKFSHHEFLIKPDILELLPKMIWHIEEPLADPAAINTFLISREAKKSGISVLLNGMGGDEIFGGYRAQLACLKAEKYQEIVPEKARKIMEKIVQYLPESNKKTNFKYIRWLKRFSEFASLPAFERYLASSNTPLTSQNFNKYFTHHMPYKKSFYYQKQKSFFYDNDLSYLNKICLNDTRTYLTDHNLNYSDKAAMAASVEGRPPLVDHRIVEFMFSLSSNFRIRKNQQKFILKKIAHNELPGYIINRPKAPFSAPMRGWLKNELKELVMDILSFESLNKRGIYNPQYVQDLIKENEKGKKDNSQLIYRLLINELWFKKFFDE